MTQTDQPRPSTASRAPGGTGFWLVAAAAAMWGTDALFRQGLALELPATTVVLYEHLILAALTFPLLRRVPWRELGVGDIVSLLVIGVGASAVATVLFTAAFQAGDPNAPLLLQKLQPIFALVAARFLLGERLTRRFFVPLVIALGAGWLITFPDPLDVSASVAIAGALAAGAAALWALGTVLGRRMSGTLGFAELTAARFAIGLPAAFLLTRFGPGRTESLALSADDLAPLLALALLPGLVALLIYYRGLRGTPASAATLAELAFPLSALVVNWFAFGATVTATQAAGIAALSAVLVGLPLLGRRRRREPLGVKAPVDAAITQR